jgi:hypothetical protein
VGEQPTAVAGVAERSRPGDPTVRDSAVRPAAWQARPPWLPGLLRWWTLPLALAAVGVLLGRALAPVWDFSLDDAWTHQSFARTLVTTGQFAFQPGRGPAGSTSPFWVLLIAPPYLIAHGQPPIPIVVGWTALLGTAALGGTGVFAGLLAADITRRVTSSRRTCVAAALVAGLATVTAWQTVAFAASGMETVFFALGALVLIFAAGRGARPAWLGLLAALVITTRPEGIIAAALVAIGSAWSALRGLPALRRPGAGQTWPLDRLREVAPYLLRWARAWAAPYAAALVVGLVPYALLNLAGSGRLLPTTVYAKAAVTAQGGSLPGMLLTSAYVGGLFLATTPAILTLAGLALVRWILQRAGRHGGERQQRRQTPTGPGSSTFPLGAVLWLWPLGLLAAFSGHFAINLSRYLVPGLPPLLALSAAGAAPLIADRGRRLLPLIGAILLAVTCMLSMVRGAQVYAGSAAATNGCWVANARWIRDHTAPGTPLATHDIGAIGYFSGHQVIDMAGLVSPEVIPMLGDQRAIEDYLIRRRVAYVAMWNGWFPPPATLQQDLAGREVYRGCGGGFIVYRTGW